MGDSVVKRPMFESYLLEAICQTIAATEEGLSNREIEKILADSRIDDIDNGNAKWIRLYNAFAKWQKIANALIIFCSLYNMLYTFPIY